MLINIYEPRDNWVLQNMADAIKRGADTSTIIRPIYYKDSIVYPDGINFFCNMGIYDTFLRNNDVTPAMRDVIMTTHVESWRPWDLRTKKLYRLPVTLIALCQRWYDFFVERGLYPVAVAIPGVDKEFFAIELERVRKDKLTVVLTGRLYRSGRKGEKWFKPLLKRVGERFRWMIIGDRWDSIIQAPFFKNFDITYHKMLSRDKYYDLFKEIDIFLSLSKIEGGPMPLIESMAAGVIPVVSDTGFAREVITEGENGFVYPVGDLKRLIQILSSLEREDLSRYRQSAREAVRDYTWENFSEKIFNVIRDVERKLKQQEGRS